MKTGDLVRKRSGRIDPYQQGTLAIVIDPNAFAKGLFMTGPLISVAYPGRAPEFCSPDNFEVLSEVPNESR